MKKERIVLDLLQEDDNSQILELSHQCPQKGMIEAYPDRSPTFNRIHKQLSQKSYHVAARSGQKLIGVFGAVYSDLFYKTQKFDAAFLLDLKVHPEHRKSTVAFRMINETVRYLREVNQTQFAVATFLKGNKHSLIFTKSRAGIPLAEHIGDFKLFSILPLIKQRVSLNFKIENPSYSDLPELVDLFNKHYANYKLAPRMTTRLLRYYIDEIEGMGLDQFWIARQNGRIKAVVCAWDEVKYKRWFVTKMNWIMKLFSFIMKMAGLLFKTPAPIKIGSPINHVSLVLCAHDKCVDGIKDILRTINNRYRGKEYTVLQTHFNALDPMNRALKGMLGFSVDTEAYAFTEDPGLATEIARDKSLIHFEWPMFI